LEVYLPRQPMTAEAVDDPSRHFAPTNCCIAKGLIHSDQELAALFLVGIALRLPCAPRKNPSAKRNAASLYFLDSPFQW
jgi:hypothetical protein